MLFSFLFLFVVNFCYKCRPDLTHIIYQFSRFWESLFLKFRGNFLNCIPSFLVTLFKFCSFCLTVKFSKGKGLAALFNVLSKVGCFVDRSGVNLELMRFDEPTDCF